MNNNSFNKKITSLDKTMSQLLLVSTQIDNKNEITRDDDNTANELMNKCYELFAEAAEELNTQNPDNIELYFSNYTTLRGKETELSILNHKINAQISNKWRTKVEKQIEHINSLENAIQAQNNEKENLAANIDNIKKESENILKKTVSSQKAVEESSNRFITIVALLVSLLAIVFGNISLFAQSQVTWQNVLLINSSILLSTCTIFTIIENGHLFSLKVLDGGENKIRINKHQIVFNIVMIVIILALVGSMVSAITIINGTTSNNNNKQ